MVEWLLYTKPQLKITVAFTPPHTQHFFFSWPCHEALSWHLPLPPRLFFFSWPCHEAVGLSLTKVDPGLHAVGAWRLSHETARDVPFLPFLIYP